MCACKTTGGSADRLGHRPWDRVSTIRQVNETCGQHTRTRSQVGRPGVFCFIVTNSLVARNKDHACGADVGQMHGVMAGARENVHVRQSKGGGMLSYRIDKCRREVGWRGGADLPHHDLTPAGMGTTHGRDLTGQLVNHHLVGMAKINGEKHTTRHRIR
jgi:hypothetical protein